LLIFDKRKKIEKKVVSTETKGIPGHSKIKMKFGMKVAIV